MPRKAEGSIDVDAASDNAVMLGRSRIAPRSGERVRIALFIRDFGIGGAERQALELSKHLDRRKYDVIVIALRGNGALKESFYSLPDIESFTLDSKWPLIVLFRLTWLLWKARIQVLHSFLASTNIYSLIVKCFLRRVKVIIGLRDSLVDPRMGYRSLVWRKKIDLLELCLKQLSFLGDLYIANSEAGKILYERKLPRKVVVVPNGIDTVRFRPDPAAPDMLRVAVGLPDGVKIVGILANCTIYKDYPTFVRAARIVTDMVKNVHFISIGEDHTSEGAAAKEAVRQLGLEKVFHFLGTREDVPALLAGLDVMCSSSVTEGFPGAIAEAMACGVPCVVTDVGDSQRVVGDKGIVVPPGNPQELAGGIVSMLKVDAAVRQPMSLAIRGRIVQNFGVAAMVKGHERLYDSLLPIPACELEVKRLRTHGRPNRTFSEVRDSRSTK